MKTKQRGLKRKCRNMVRRIEEETVTFPRRHDESGYWHLHLPVASALVDSRATAFKVRRLCVQTLIRCAHHLANLAPALEETRVVVAITLRALWASQIIVFFGPDYFDGFFDRNTESQKWTLIEEKLSRQWHLEVPTAFNEQTYTEEIREDDFVHRGQICFIGQL